MGSPEYPSTRQIDKLHEASEMTRDKLRSTVKANELQFRVQLLPHSLTLVSVNLNPSHD